MITLKLVKFCMWLHASKYMSGDNLCNAWKSRFEVNKKFSLVFTWSGFCHTQHPRTVQTITKHVNSKKTIV